jgi:uncharacterized protein YbjT (DUF2867 family)
MSIDKTAIILGSTGLIGSHILSQLIDDPSYSNIRLILRKPISFSHPKVQSEVIDFKDEVQYRAVMTGADTVFCAIGTTMKKVDGDKALYRTIDYDIVWNGARFSREAGCPQFLLVSSLGANSKSGNFYLRLKGEVEEALQTLGFPSLSIFRPSMLLGQRNESRSGEHFIQTIMQGISFLLPHNWRPIAGADVARAMVAAAAAPISGVHLYHYREMQKLIA